MGERITIQERLETVEQQASYLADCLRSFLDGSITDGDRRDAEELLAEYDHDRDEWKEG